MAPAITLYNACGQRCLLETGQPCGQYSDGRTFKGARRIAGRWSVVWTTTAAVRTRGGWSAVPSSAIYTSSITRRIASSSSRRHTARCCCCGCCLPTELAISPIQTPACPSSIVRNTSRHWYHYHLQLYLSAQVMHIHVNETSL